MANGRLAESIWGITALERADDATIAPGLGARDDGSREQIEIVELECESAERVAGERVEAGRYQNELRHEAGSGSVDAALERLYVLAARESGSLGDVPDRAMGPAV